MRCDERWGHAAISFIDEQGVTFNFNGYSTNAYRVKVYRGAVILSSFTLPKPEIIELLICNSEKSYLMLLHCLSVGAS